MTVAKIELIPRPLGAKVFEDKYRVTVADGSDRLDRTDSKEVTLTHTELGAIAYALRVFDFVRLRAVEVKVEAGEP